VVWSEVNYSERWTRASFSESVGQYVVPYFFGQVIRNGVVVSHCAFKVTNKAVVLNSVGGLFAKGAGIGDVEAAGGAEAASGPTRRRCLAGF
jgi:hypothetical protein